MCIHHRSASHNGRPLKGMQESANLRCASHDLFNRNVRKQLKAASGMILNCSLESGPPARSRKAFTAIVFGIGLPQYSAHTQSGSASELHEQRPAAGSC